MLVTYILVAFVFAFSSAEDVISYRNFKVWEVTPESEEQVFSIRSFKNEFNLDVWEELHAGHSSRILVNPDLNEDFQKFLSKCAIAGHVIISDLETVFESERRELDFHARRVRKQKEISKRLNVRHTVDFDHFWSHDEINEYIEEITEDYPDLVERILVANSTEGRQSYAVIITLDRNDTSKPISFMDCGVHAREWIAFMQCVYTIHELVEHPYAHGGILNNTDVIIIPAVNPDGYEHSREVARLWRKTRRPNENSTCIGTDGNRNYLFQWQAGTNPCSETWSGTGPFSEPEIAGIHGILRTYQSRIMLSVSVHSYGQWMLYPWGYDTILISNWEQHHELGDIFADAVRNVSGTEYTVGNSAILLYPAAGGSDDYAASLGIPYAFTLELPGGGQYGFDIPAARIHEVASETMTGFTAMAVHLLAVYGNNTQPTEPTTSSLD